MCWNGPYGPAPTRRKSFAQPLDRPVCSVLSSPDCQPRQTFLSMMRGDADVEFDRRITDCPALDVAALVKPCGIRLAHLDPRLAAGELERTNPAIRHLPGAVGILARHDHRDLRRLRGRGARLAARLR